MTARRKKNEPSLADLPCQHWRHDTLQNSVFTEPRDKGRITACYYCGDPVIAVLDFTLTLDVRCWLRARDRHCPDCEFTVELEPAPITYRGECLTYRHGRWWWGRAPAYGACFHRFHPCPQKTPNLDLFYAS